MKNFISEFTADEIEEAFKMLINIKREEYSKIIDSLEKEQCKRMIENITTDSDLLEIKRDCNNIIIKVNEDRIKEKFSTKIIKCGIMENEQINNNLLLEKENTEQDMIFEFNYVWNKQGYLCIIIPNSLKNKKRIYLNDEEIQFNIKNEEKNIIYMSNELNFKKYVIKIVEV